MKDDLDFAKSTIVSHRNSLAFHAGVGVAVLYGDAKIVPFERRYFPEEANSIRGRSVCNLGSGPFAGDGNFMNQSGDIKLDASIEYRTRLFWKLHGAAFIDAGSIWTTHECENQPGGVFKFDKSCKRIAVAYELGPRLDSDFFVLRFDRGIKAVSPKYERAKERCPIIHPEFSRDLIFYLVVGYPFWFY